MVKPRIVNAKDVKRVTRKAPATRIIESLPDGLLSSGEVAEHFEVNIETIRRLARKRNADGSKRFKAPSKAATSGEMVIWAYTQADMEELAAYFGKKAPQPRKGKTRKG